jgi:cellulose synthase/poly-beta-1,6-N-acetylglucosamine synthase-like glycosyltransferase
MPFVSVVIPTRNRPEFVRSALESVRAQTFADFEVIVSDNHTGQSCQAVFEEFASDPRFRYVSPETPLPMHDNWEMVCGLARGEYVTVLIDKTILKPSALQAVHDCAQGFDADLLSWRADSFIPDDANSARSPGVYYAWPQPESEPHLFDAHAELQRRFSFDVRRGTEGEHYFLGKICFGAFHRRLMDRIRTAAGRVFYPIAPDYTSMLSALAVAERAVNAGRACLVQNITQLSNGWNVAHHPERARAFLAEIDPTGSIIAGMPIAGLYGSIHNIVAHDYVTMQRRLAQHFPTVSVDMGNLITRAAEDMRTVIWSDRAERRDQLGALAAATAALPDARRKDVMQAIAETARAERRVRLRSALRKGLMQVPFGRSVLQLTGRQVSAVSPDETPQNHYMSVNIAAAACDEVLHPAQRDVPTPSMRVANA